MTDLHATLVRSAISTGAAPSALADLRAIIERTDTQLAALRARKTRDGGRIAFLEERRRRCVRAVGEMEGSTV
jgi:hypothetical protein